MSDLLPETLTRYRLPNSRILYGQNKKARYLFQDIYTPSHHVCFINIFSEKEHTFYLLKHTPTYYVQIQLENSLDCHYKNLPDSIMYEWAINLFHANKLFAEINAAENKNYSTVIIFIADAVIKKFAASYPVIKKFEQQQHNSEHTIKLFSGNGICSFEIMDLIKAIKQDADLQADNIHKLVNCVFELLNQKRMPKQTYIDAAIVNKIYSLKNYMVENLKKDFHRNELTKEFALSYYHFDKGFSKIYNATPFRLIKYYRMSAVIDELKDNKKNVKELAANYNYSYNAFIRAFHSIYKKHPAKYRQEKISKRKPRSNYRRSSKK